MAADVTQSDNLPAQSSASGGGNDLMAGFNSLNVLRQFGLMIGLAISVAVGVAIVMWSREPDYRAVYGNLDNLDAAQVSEILDNNNIKYKIDTKNGALLVASDDVNKARLKLAEVGLPGDSNVGFELLDQEQPLGSSQFMESARYRRSLEGELARTITSINSVRSARVHLAIPKASVFVRDAREPRASVFLELFAGRTLTPQQVQAIGNLVASSISELNFQDVTIVDQKGQLYSTETENSEFVMAGKQQEYTRNLEKDYTRRVSSIIQPIVGNENYRAEVSADIDFTEIEQAAETFNPDLPAIRSEQTLEESRANGSAIGGIPGALSNQPPGGGQAPEQAVAQDGEAPVAPPNNTRNQATRNFELDRTISYTKHQVGKLRRLTVAVVLNDKITVDPETQAETRVSWTQAELDRLSVLVRDAVGYSASRGDSVNIINSPFFVPPLEAEIEISEPAIWEQAWFLSILKQVGGVLVVLGLLFGLVRPVLKNLSHSGLRVREMDDARELASLEAAGLNSLDSLSDETVTLSGGGSLSLPSPEQDYEQRLNTVRGLIADDPGRVAQVVKRWAAVEE
ncbi:flagellar basal-body MS-ring/collar protein FliF [Aurantivibrio infirmus]